MQDLLTRLPSPRVPVFGGGVNLNREIHLIGRANTGRGEPGGWSMAVITVL